MKNAVALLLLGWMLCAATAVYADSPAANSLFDPARHMRVSEVKPGMKGYGLSVWRGSKIERFDVEVIDVVKNFNPTFDAVLVRCKGPFLEHTGSIEGMSGSPIYLYDESGKARMVGAFAYGWPLAKDPVGGVQPIEYMLQLPAGGGGNSSGAGVQAQGVDKTSQGVHPRWSIDDVKLFSHRRSQSQDSGNLLVHGGDRELSLQPLATPLMAGGMSSRTLAAVEPLFDGTGLTLMQAGVGGGSSGGRSDGGDAPPPPLEPGSVLAVPLLFGDLELTAIGTCTEVIGNHFFGFGHHFADEPSHGEGPMELPMGSGSIKMVVANLNASFKFGFLSKPMGTMTTDHVVGIAGEIGRQAPLIPVQLHVVYEDGSFDRTFHFQSALHPKLTPLISAVAMASALTSERDLPEYHTLSYSLTLEFEGGRKMQIVNTSVNAGAGEIVTDLALPIAAALDNPFQTVPIRRIEGTVSISSMARSGQITAVMLSKAKYKPGEALKGYVSYRPFQSDETTMPFELDLPTDLPNGNYQMRVSDWAHYMDDEKMTSPFRFTAQDIDQLFKLLDEITAIHRDALYLRLVRQADGVAVGRTEMPKMPSASREVLLQSGRSDITRFVSSTVKVVHSDVVMSGAAEFPITIERQGKVEVAVPGDGN